MSYKYYWQSIYHTAKNYACNASVGLILVELFLLTFLAAPVLRSCEELKLAGYNTDGYYDIDPDEPGFGKPAFTVYCDMSATGSYVV